MSTNPASDAPDRPENDTALLQFLHAIPKVEIHCHLLGTVREDTFMAWTRRAIRAAGAGSGATGATGAEVPLTEEEARAFYVRGEKPVGVLKALRALDAFLITHPDDLHRLVYEYLQDASAHQVRHAEFFWNPTGTAQASGIAYPRALEAIVRAIHDARTDFGIDGWLIAAIDRQASPQAAVEMVEWVTAYRREEVLGIGIDYNEVDHPPEWFASAYANARRAGLKTTAHAGEFGMPWVNVKTAVEVLQVDRVDHGYTLVDEPEYAARCAERGLIFTVVPTNSFYLRTLPKARWAQDHPIRRMPGLGLRIHPNTDDPTLHKVTPTGAWHMMVKDFGFSLDDLRGFMRNGLDGAWMDPGQRRQWQTEFDAEFDRLRAAIVPVR